MKRKNLIYMLLIAFITSFSVFAQENDTQQNIQKVREQLDKAAQEATERMRSASNEDNDDEDQIESVTNEAAQYQPNPFWAWIGNHGILVLILCAAITLTYFYITHRDVIIGLISIFTGGMRQASKSTLTPAQCKQVALGAPYAEQQSAFQNTLKTGVGASKRTTILCSYWDIHDHESAIDTLNYLRDKGHRFYFPTICKVIATSDKEQQKNIILADMKTQEDVDKTVDQIRNFYASMEEMQKIKLVQSAADVPNMCIDAWDAGRLAFMARLCYDAKLISEEEAWKYLGDAEKVARANCNSWERFGRGYVFGRYLWGGPNNYGSVYNDYVNDLLKKPKSPWVKNPW